MVASDADFASVVAVAEGRVIGAARTHHYSEADPAGAPAGHYLGGIVVHPQWRRRGIASALTAARLGWVWERTGSCWYFANASNTAFIRLHEAFGFRQVLAATALHGVPFEGGLGLLFEASPPCRPLAAG